NLGAIEAEALRAPAAGLAGVVGAAGIAPAVAKAAEAVHGVASFANAALAGRAAGVAKILGSTNHAGVAVGARKAFVAAAGVGAAHGVGTGGQKKHCATCERLRHERCEADARSARTGRGVSVSTRRSMQRRSATCIGR